jgi:hypothetical protein
LDLRVSAIATEPIVQVINGNEKNIRFLVGENRLAQ